MVILILVAPQLFPVADRAAPRQVAARSQQDAAARSCSCSRGSIGRRQGRPIAAEPSDKDRVARAPERRQEADESAAVLARQHARSGSKSRRSRPARGQGPQPDRPRASRRQTPSAGTPQQLPESQSALQMPSTSRRRAQNGAQRPRRRRRAARSATRCRTCSATSQSEQFDNPQGGGGQFGPEIQFDTKGVEFGPWVRRFIAQVKRNWLIPVRGDVDEGARRRHVQRAQGRLDHRLSGRRPVRASTRSTTPRSARCRRRIRPQPLPPEYPDRQGVLHGHVLLQRRRRRGDPVAAARAR